MNSTRSKLGTFAAIIIAVLLLAGYAGGDVSASSLSGGGAPAASGPGVVQPTIPTEPTAPDTADLGDANAPAKSDCCNQGSIGDTVWNDANNNGLQDESDAGFANVTVNLYQDGSLIRTTQTEAGTTGYYLFDNLATGTYVVDVDESTLPAGAQLTTANEPLTVVLSCCNSSDTADFGYFINPDSPDLALSKVLSSADPAVVGADVSFTIFITNTGDSTIAVLPLQDVYEPSKLSFVSATPASDDNNDDGVIDWADLGPLASGQSTSVEVRFLAIAPTGGTTALSNLSAQAFVATTTEPTDDGLLDDGYTLVEPTVPGTADLGGANAPAKSDCCNQGSIGDTVWNDVNNNGLQDESDAGFANVTVNLYQDGSLIRTTQTEAGTTGYYLFDNLPTGTYVVDVDESTLPAGAQLTTANEPLTVVLSCCNSSDTADFGYFLSNGSIGDQVFYDLDRNGAADAGEPGLVGVTVNLYQGTCAAPGALFRTATTTGTGFYDFPELPPADYCVDVDESTLPAAVQLTTANEPLTVSLAPDQDYNDADFGYSAHEPDRTCDLATAAGAVSAFGTDLDPRSDSACVEILSGTDIGDFVWNDLDADGIQEAGEPPVVGLTVWLYDSGNTLQLTTTTDANGIYSFTTVPLGDYFVQFDLPTGAKFSPQDQGSNDAVDSDPDPTTGKTAVFSLASTTPDLTRDAGQYCLNSISGIVFFDANQDQTQGLGENGIPGVILDLYLDNGDNTFDPNTDTVISNTTTASDGAYSFLSLEPGTYFVVEQQPDGYDSTTVNSRMVSIVGSCAGASSTDNNFGEVYGSIGDFIFLDSNGNGTQEPSEQQGVVNVLVTVTNLGSGDVYTTTSNSNGVYTVDNLPSGTYQIDVPASMPGLQRTTSAPKDYTLGVGENYVEADFGYIAPTVVALADFSASRTSQGNLIQWQTASELDQTGFIIWRSSAENGTYKAVSGLVSATNRPEGATYQWLDTLADAHTPTWYKIESVPDGALFGPVSVQPQPGDGGQILFIPLMIR